MLGGLLTMAIVALADGLISRSIDAWRALVYVLLLGITSVLMTSLPALWFPAFPAPLLLALNAGLGPLCGALALNYLGLWLGAAALDRVVHRVLTWGATALATAAVLLVAGGLCYSGPRPADVLELGALASTVGLLLALVASIRARALGDKLALWMSLAGLFMGGMILGLYTFTMHPEWFGWPGMALTALSTVAHFLVVTAMTVQRNQQLRQLERLAGLAQGADPATGLPTGSVLLSKVDDAFWRSARAHRQCTVICLHLHNLYALGESTGHRVDQQILTVITARIRRAVGFRCVVGLYHPRCFVVVVSDTKDAALVERTVLRLRRVLSQPMSVVGLNAAFHAFTPRYGMGVVTVDASNANPTAVVDLAERKSWANAGMADPADSAANLTTY